MSDACTSPSCIVADLAAAELAHRADVNDEDNTWDGIDLRDGLGVSRWVDDVFWPSLVACWGPYAEALGPLAAQASTSTTWPGGRSRAKGIYLPMTDSPGGSVFIVLSLEVAAQAWMDKFSYLSGPDHDVWSRPPVARAVVEFSDGRPVDARFLVMERECVAITPKTDPEEIVRRFVARALRSMRTQDVEGMSELPQAHEDEPHPGLAPSGG